MATDSSHCDPLVKRLGEPGPKRLLSLDGGGIRGLISLGFLTKAERVLRCRYGKPDLVLSDYFDLIGGTSTGSIIAGLLALGFSVEDIRRLNKNEIEAIKRGNKVENVSALDTVGALAAKRQVAENHFPPCFDRPVPL